MKKSAKQNILKKLYNSKLLRTMLYPEMVLYRKYLRWEYAKSEDSEYIRSLRGKYEGKRCFVIGNGPSLTPEDLDRIKGEYSFASNRIYYIYDKTQWRPTWYVSNDNVVIFSEIDNIKQSGDYPKLLNYKAKKYGRKKEENIHYFFFNNGKFYIDPLGSEKAAESLHDDLSKYVTRVATVTVTAIEFAIYMGFKEIYLLGVDNSYIRQTDKSGKVYVDTTKKADYFAGMKNADGKVGDCNSIAPIDALNYAYELAKEFSEKHGVKIYNATRGGKLEVFERVDFDSLFKS